MKTKHVPNLELCQELDRLCKEKGIVVPETEYYWWKTAGDNDWKLITAFQKRGYEVLRWVQTFLPAPLVSEQGEWLPDDCDYFSGKNWNDEMFGCNVHRGRDWCFRKEANTEANARQKMINYLLAEGIITKL